MISAVKPYPGNSGQQMRVRNKLLGFRKHFHITFLTFDSDLPDAEGKLREYVDIPIVLPSLYMRSPVSRLINKYRAGAFARKHSLKESNFIIGELELPPRRVANAVDITQYDVVLFEYWHTHNLADLFASKRLPTVLDMHDILWKSYERSVHDDDSLPVSEKQQKILEYRTHEESAWNKYDAIIAINRAEGDLLQNMLPADKKIFYAPMGIDMTNWAYQWEPAVPIRLGYYGGLGNPYNRRDAMFVYEEIMPNVWNQHPEADYWIVGSNPPDSIRSLQEKDKRVKVTGFVDKVQDVLKEMSIILCPFEGTFGFRSRIIEVMALGIPIVATWDAVYGMDLNDGSGIYLRSTGSQMADAVLQLLNDKELLQTQSRIARQTVESLYSFDRSYGRLSEELYTYLENVKA